MSNGDEIHGNDAPRVAKLNCLACRLPLLAVASQNPVRQFMLNGGRDEKTGLRKPLPNYGNRLNNVVQTNRQVEKNIRVNGDQLWPVWSCRHSKVSGILLPAFLAPCLSAC